MGGLYCTTSECFLKTVHLTTAKILTKRETLRHAECFLFACFTFDSS